MTTKLISALDATALYTTVDEIAASIPLSYQPGLKTFLSTLASAGEKASHAAEAIRSFKQHQTAGTFPNALNTIGVPVIQCSKEFTVEAKCSTELQALQAQVMTAKRNCLQQMISIKQAELKFYNDDCTNPDKAAAIFTSKTKAIASSIATSYGGPSKVPDQLDNDETNTLALAELLTSRAIQCGYAAHQKVLENKMRKLSLKQKADVAMTSGTGIDKTTIEKIVCSTLDKRQSLSDQKKRKRASSKRPLSPTRITKHTDTGSLCEEFTTPTEESTEKGYFKDPAEPQAKRQRRRQEIQEEVQELMDLRGPRFRVKDAISYPDVFLESTEYARLCFVILNTPVSWFETLRYSSPGVHKHPDVILPHAIEYSLALNLKHIFHQKLNHSLPSTAFSKFQRSVRIRWAMRNTPNDENFVARFHIRSSWDPPQAAPHIEAGLEAGKQELFSQIPYISLNAIASSTQISDRMSIRPVTEYIIEHRLMTCITDKNLGIAVLPVQWYDDCMKRHVENGPYDLVSLSSMRTVHDELLRINLTHLPDQLYKYILNQPVPDNVPTLYSIPKIYKDL
jgi:hypothetical protein